MTRQRALARAGIVVLAALVVDQVTKAIVTRALDRGEEDPVLPFLTLVNVRNDGVAFGIDAGGQAVVIVLISIALIGLVAYFVRHAERPGLWLPTGLLVGGALGNIVDRIREGAVVDFVKLPAWPAFNVADVAIVAGVIAFVVVLERRGAPRPA
jgi:signal peptidase II